jgi:NosR/NirI family nitrous oxide reductase transcriptional regulator
MRLRGTEKWLTGLCVAATALVLSLVIASPAAAEKGKLLERLTPDVMRVIYPEGAERLGPEEGNPPAIAVYKGDKPAAYLFSTLDIIAAPGYSTTPFDVIGGIDTEGRITGAKVVFHNEPHITHDTRRQRELDELLASQAGRLLRGGTDKITPDYVADSTVSARAMRTAVLVTASMVFRSRAARGTAAAAQVASDTFRIKTVAEMLADGSLVKRRVTSGDVAAALKARGAQGAKLDWPLGKEDDLYIEFSAAPVTPTAIGGNLLGVVRHEEYKNSLPEGAEAIYIASSGPYNFLGSKYYQSSEGNRFDRLRVVQGGKTFTFVEKDYTYSVPISGQELAGLFVLAPKSGFDPKKPWRLDLLVNATANRPITIAFGLDYKLPDLLLNPPAAETQVAATDAQDANLAPEDDFDLELPAFVPAWVEAWEGARGNAVILAGLLAALTAIFLFQGQLSRNRLAHKVVRYGFLAIVLVWLGWTARVQLSTVHVINYVTAGFQGSDIGFFLAEPLILIIAVYTLISILLIGRGVFCGWLCPFGALQELLAQVSRILRVPQWNPKPELEQRLWMGKYIAAAAVLVLVMTGIDADGMSLELEPFKTAITSKFTRDWPYMLYAAIIIAIGLFSERAYCRFLCPLGGVLAAMDRLHLLNLLKRRPESGSPCRLCERSCPVRAIVPSGKIVTAECFQCLDCQVEYYDDKRCPPLARAVKLRGEGKKATATVKHA